MLPRDAFASGHLLAWENDHFEFILGELHQTQVKTAVLPRIVFIFYHHCHEGPQTSIHSNTYGVF
jgi:hypothetical protein